MKLKICCCRFIVVTKYDIERIAIMHWMQENNNQIFKNVNFCLFRAQKNPQI
jgi:hypothetical protein